MSNQVLVGKKTITIDEEQFYELISLSRKRKEQLSRMKDYNRKHDSKLNEKKECPECGALIVWRGYNKHRLTQKHLDAVEKLVHKKMKEELEREIKAIDEARSTQ